MVQNLRMLNMKKDDIYVSDSWRATPPAVKQIRLDLGLNPDVNRQGHLKHEMVVHNDGEIVNARGYTTNAIEGKWSEVKRWIRKRNGGKLPSHSDRALWTLLLDEFCMRKILSEGHTTDYGNTFVVPLHLLLSQVFSYA